MYISEILISNFRSIESLTIRLTEGLNMIVGANNLGKTTVLDALRAAMGAASAGSDAIRLDKSDLRHDREGKPLNKPIRIDVFFSGLTVAEQAEFLDAMNFDPKDASRTTASIHFEWTWLEDSKRYHSRRWGGNKPNAETALPEDVLQSVPLTLLGALRDALTALMPGRYSRIGRLLDAKADDGSKARLVSIAKAANSQFEKTELLKEANTSIMQALTGASGKTLSQEAFLRPLEPDFERIAASLQFVLKMEGEDPATKLPNAQSIRTNGLGYNNLLYIAAVLAELEATAKTQPVLPILLVEEPEAHLHPQLQVLLASHIAKTTSPGVQTIVTSHSPTIASHVSPDRLHVLHQDREGNLHCTWLGGAGLPPDRFRQLQRMLDVTRASLLFARGVILVEGLAEILLLPVLAQRLNISLDEEGISVVSVCGVDFGTIAQLFGPQGLHIPVAIVTDGDPGVEREVHWKEEVPARTEGGSFKICGRVQRLKKQFRNNSYVQVYHSGVTLEYDLAVAGPKNPYRLCDAWQACGADDYFSKDELKARDGSLEAQGLIAWRRICRARTGHGKGAFAQNLADLLEGKPHQEFAVPAYIAQAIAFVTRKQLPPGEATVPQAAQAASAEGVRS